MSNGTTPPVPDAKGILGFTAEKRFKAKDTAIFAGWIAGLIIIAAFCWVLSQPARNRYLVRSVNRVLEQSGDSRRLGVPSSPGGFFWMGAWFTMTEIRQPEDTGRRQFSEGTKAFIFSFLGEGTFFPCAAVMAPDGKIQEFIPLNRHGERMIKRISPGVLNIYANRIERIES